MPRLGFSKSRRGCLKCRQRRVKCDERRPDCSACIRHGLPCSLGEVAVPNGSVTSHRGTPVNRPTPVSRNHWSLSGDTDSPLASGDSQFPYLSSLVKTPETQSSEAWTLDLELMHHYTTIIWKSLPKADKVGDIWQIELPKLAATHEFLMHQLLAISAIHMARLCPGNSSTYSIRATQHQNKAIQLLQSTLPVVTNTNCPAVYLTASLLSIGEFAALSSPSPQQSRPGIDDLLRVFHLVRGMNSILKSYEGTIALSSIGTLLQLGHPESGSPLLEGIMDQLESVRPPSTMDLATATTFQKGCTSLMRWVTHASRTSELPELRVVMTWPIDVTDGFTDLLRRRNGDALRVLDCYCRIMESLGSDHWYLEGWGRYVRDDICKPCSWH